MGRQSAGIGLIQAIADTRPQRLYCAANTMDDAKDCAQTLASFGSPETEVAYLPTEQPHLLSKAGLLFRPDPVIGPHAWHRLSRSTPHSYSLCGVTMTISTHAAMSALNDYLVSPLQSWDALICISSAGREAVHYLLGQAEEHLRERLGAHKFTLPQLPVIPLGVHTQRVAKTLDERAAARARFDIDEGDVAVLYAGRLSVRDKAHPLAMYLALEAASQGRRVVLIQAGVSPSADDARVYSEEPPKICPSVRTIIVNGTDAALYRAAWSAADIFTSLSDNFQETFGLTPVEAMAAGLPVVVSDWDGYRDSVRHGIDGFRVPTLTLDTHQGSLLADRYDLGIEDYARYSGYTSQLVAVDVEAAAKAYRLLIDSPDLRSRMGEAGRARALETFDWSVILARYRSLWDELSELRRAAGTESDGLSRRRRPDRASPFAMFASYPSFRVGPGLRVRRRDGVTATEALARRDLLSTRFATTVQPTLENSLVVLNAIGAQWTDFDAVVGACKALPTETVAAALVWFCKVGALEFQGSEDTQHEPQTSLEM